MTNKKKKGTFMQCRKKENERKTTGVEFLIFGVLMLAVVLTFGGIFVSIGYDVVLGRTISLVSFASAIIFLVGMSIRNEFVSYKKKLKAADEERDLAIFEQKKVLRSADMRILMKKCAVAGTFLTIPEKRSLEDYKNQGLDIVEVNLEWADQYADESDNRLRPMFEKFINNQKDMFVIIKCRPKFEEGNWKGTEAKRVSLLVDLAKYVDAVDVELDMNDLPVMVDAIKEDLSLAIVSKHNYANVDNMKTLNYYADSAFEKGADIFKYAGYVRRKKDLERLLSFAKDQIDMGRKCIVSGMGTGTYAKMAREQLPKYSCVAYANVNDSDERLGQLSLEDTIEAAQGKNGNVQR